MKSSQNTWVLIQSLLRLQNFTSTARCINPTKTKHFEGSVKKLMKIVYIEEGIYLLSDLRKLNEIFEKNMTYDNIRKHIFEKTLIGGRLVGTLPCNLFRINPFLTNIPFLYSLKTSKSQRLSARNRLNLPLFSNTSSDFSVSGKLLLCVS